jgi:hypothetical protein
MIASLCLLLVQVQSASITGSYRLYVSAMSGTVAINAPAGVLTMRKDSTYMAAGRSGRYALKGGVARFLSGPYTGGTATFSPRGSHMRVNIVTSFPDHPGRKLKLFGNRS